MVNRSFVPPDCRAWRYIFLIIGGISASLQLIDLIALKWESWLLSTLVYISFKFIGCRNRGGLMQFIGKSKIGKQYLKSTITHPIIRLPRQYSEAIGTSVRMYKSEHAGKPHLSLYPIMKRVRPWSKELHNQVQKLYNLWQKPTLSLVSQPSNLQSKS